MEFFHENISNTPATVRRIQISRLNILCTRAQPFCLPARVMHYCFVSHHFGFRFHVAASALYNTVTTTVTYHHGSRLNRL